MTAVRLRFLGHGPEHDEHTAERRLSLATLYREVTLGLSTAELWAHVTRIGGTCGMIANPVECTSDGDTRTCTTADGTRFVENILGTDETHQRIGYSGYMMGGSALPTEFHAASMQVIDAGDGRATLRWITDIKPDEALESMQAIVDIGVAALEARHPLATHSEPLPASTGARSD